jgi:hypothetical protein
MFIRHLVFEDFKERLGGRRGTEHVVSLPIINNAIINNKTTFPILYISWPEP